MNDIFQTEETHISIIIPNYNNVCSLLHLLDTIPPISYIETIIVDDRSTEDISIVKDYIDEQREKRISLLINDGKKGAGTCRNIGISHAIGKWLIFADADDYFVDKWIERVNKYIDSDYELVYFSPTSIDLSSGSVSSRHVLYERLVNDYVCLGGKKQELDLRYLFCTPWSKMILRDLVYVNNISFDEVPASNDIMFMTKCAFFSKDIVADKETIYCVTRGGKSLTAKKNIENFMSRVYVFVDRCVFLRENLSQADYDALHMDRYAIGKLAFAIIDGYGIKTFMEVRALFKKNEIKIFDIGLINPITLFKSASLGFSWLGDIRKNRKRNET